MKFIVIGITDNPKPCFPPEVMEIIRRGKVFSGGKRHHEIVAPFLPADAQWIDITAPIDSVFEQYHDEVVVFASGDPLFFGFANTIKRRMPDAEIVVFPTFNSLQMLAHRLVMPYHDMRIVSLTGRPWSEFDKALIERAEKIGVLTDKEHTPATIAQRMLEYGYTNYTIYVGEHLGNPSLEKVTTLTLEEAAKTEFAMPNCLILYSCNSSDSCSKKETWFGIPGINVHIGDFLETDITALPHPNAVFIGGHGGELKEIMKKVLTVLTDDGIIVFNSVVAPKVTVDSKKLWDEACKSLGLQQLPPLHIQLNDNHPITILKCSR